MMKDIFKILEDIGIKYQEYKHPAVYTVEEAEKYDRGKAGHSKNLFLRNRKGNKHYLVVLDASKRINLKELALLLSESDLSFASPERMIKYLSLTPGSVSPLGLINDNNKEVQVIVDNELLKSENQGFHPNINTSTLVISTDDFKKFLEYTQNPVIYLDL